MQPEQQSQSQSESETAGSNWSPPHPTTSTTATHDTTSTEPKSTTVFNHQQVSQLAATEPNDSLRPIPVVRVLSPVGVEYVFLTISLFVAAGGLIAALLSIFNGKFDFAVLAFPVATLIVAVPVFAVIFLHLKKLELQQPALKLDPSKRRSTQFTQIFSFLVSLFTLIGLVFAIFAKFGGTSSVSIGKALLDALAVLVVSGGILAYYWRDEHKNR